MDKLQLKKNPQVLFLLDEHLDEPNVISYSSRISTIEKVLKEGNLEISKCFTVIYIPDDLKISKEKKEKLKRLME